MLTTDSFYKGRVSVFGIKLENIKESVFPETFCLCDTEVNCTNALVGNSVFEVKTELKTRYAYRHRVFYDKKQIIYTSNLEDFYKMVLVNKLFNRTYTVEKMSCPVSLRTKKIIAAKSLVSADPTNSTNSSYNPDTLNIYEIEIKGDDGYSASNFVLAETKEEALSLLCSCKKLFSIDVDRINSTTTLCTLNVGELCGYTTHITAALGEDEFFKHLFTSKRIIITKENVLHLVPDSVLNLTANTTNITTNHRRSFPHSLGDR